VLTECNATLFDFAPVEGRQVVAAFDGGTITSDAGALLLGETDRAIRLTDRFASCFIDTRMAELVEHEVATMVLQRVVGIALGYEDLNDHDELRHDPVLAVIAGKLAAKRADCAPLAGKSTLNRLELCVVDRLIQQAVLQVLQEQWDSTFSEHSYGFRPGRSAHQAVAQAQRYVAEGYNIVVDLDLEKFFDRVNHDGLMARVAARISDKRVLKLIRAFLTAGVMEDGLVLPVDEGTPQGGPLTP
jgi:hypothetical protein